MSASSAPRGGGFVSGHGFSRALKRRCQKTLSSRAKKIVRETDDLRSRGTCWLLGAPELPVKSRSLHARNDRLRQSLCLVGMTGLGRKCGDKKCGTKMREREKMRENGGQTGRSPIPNLSPKRIPSRQPPRENLAVLQVFGVKGRALPLLAERS